MRDAQQNGYCSFFHMDETEITNSEYKFVEWVKDSELSTFGNISWWVDKQPLIQSKR
jgi:hypothetical protein